MRLFLLWATVALLGCGPVTSEQRGRSLSARESPHFATVDEPSSTERDGSSNRERWEGAATAVLFVIVLLGSAALPILLLL